MNSLSLNRLEKWIITVSAVFISIPVMAAHPWEKWADEFGLDPNVSYDGTRIMTMAHGEFEIREHKAPQKMYTEFNMGNMSGAFILREDLDKAYTLMPSMGMYREMSLSEGLYESGGGMEFSDIKVAGEETINGYPCVKYSARFTDKEGKGVGFIWMTDSGVPMKMDMIYSNAEQKGMRISTELVDLNLRPQDPSIFELPSGLKPMGMSGMAGLSGMLGGAQGGDAAPGAGGLADMFKNMTPEQQEALSGAGLEGLIPGMGQQEPQAAPAGAARSAPAQAESMSVQLTTDNLTQSVQYHLQYLGIDPGNTDGELSLDTQIAISEYQASKGMPVTGEVSPQLLGILSAEVDSQ